jgi:hypothetical protein
MMRLTVGAIVGFVMISASLAPEAHQFGTNPPTWNREISRLVYDRCAGCHREGATAFPMMTYQDVQPRAVATRTLC